MNLIVRLRLLCWNSCSQASLLFEKFVAGGVRPWRCVVAGPCSPILSCPLPLPLPRQTDSHETVSRIPPHLSWILTATSSLCWEQQPSQCASWPAWSHQHCVSLGFSGKATLGYLHAPSLWAFSLAAFPRDAWNRCPYFLHWSFPLSRGTLLWGSTPACGVASHESRQWGWSQCLLHADIAPQCCLPSVPATSNPPAGGDSTGWGSSRQEIGSRPQREGPWPSTACCCYTRSPPSTQNFLRDK